MESDRKDPRPPLAWSPACGGARLCVQGDGVALVKSLMQHDPKRRLLLVDALEHPFFNDVDKVHVGTRPIEGMPAP